jgi:hypothetical protein
MLSRRDAGLMDLLTDLRDKTLGPLELPLIRLKTLAQIGERQRASSLRCLLTLEVPLGIEKVGIDECREEHAQKELGRPRVSLDEVWR